MSRRRVPRQLVTSAFLLLVLGATSCIFSPKPAPPKDPCETNPVACQPPASPEALIQKLSYAYQQRDIVEFTKLFPTATGAPRYFFFLNEPLPDGSTNWGLTEELRIHRRMFRPEDTPPGETPVPTELWLSSVSITLTRRADFTERPDLYIPGGGELDPARWKAMQADYDASILFDTNSETDYRVEGIANFVVIEDLDIPSGQEGKFLIYRWEDLGTRKPNVAKPAPAPTT